MNCRKQHPKWTRMSAAWFFRRNAVLQSWWYLPSLLPSYPPPHNYVPLFFFPIRLSAGCRWLADVRRILLDIPDENKHGELSLGLTEEKAPREPGLGPHIPEHTHNCLARVFAKNGIGLSEIFTFVGADDMDFLLRSIPPCFGHASSASPADIN